MNCYCPYTNEKRMIQLNQMVGAVVPWASGGVIVAMESGFYTLNLETEALKKIYDPECDLPENRFNDGKCDPYGRFWAGTTDLIGIHEKGALYCLDTDLSVKKKIDRVNTSNGLAWSPNNKYMYFIDTPTKKVVQFDYDVHTGNIENKKDIILIPEGEGIPDGMTIDVEGNLWISHWGGYKISKWNPQTGEHLLSIPIPAKNVTSCTFGGKDLNELYITTARMRMDKDELEKYPYAGGVFKMKVDVRGFASVPFRG